MRTFVWILLGLWACVCVAGQARAEAPKPCSGEFRDSATWLSVAHPGLGEYFLRGWGPFFEHAPTEEVLAGLHPDLRLARLPAGQEHLRRPQVPTPR